MKIASGLAGWKSRLDGLFVDRELFMRANGKVRFIRISAKFQRVVASVAASAAFVWLIIMVVMLFNQADVMRDRLALDHREALVEDSESKVAAYRGTIDQKTQDLEKRQQFLEDVVKDYFGDQPSGDKPAVRTEGEANGEQAGEIQSSREIGALDGLAPAGLIPGAPRLALVERRQLGFVTDLTETATERTRKAAAAIRKLGLDPEQMARRMEKEAAGGPYIPFFGLKTARLDPRFERLDKALKRMDALERTLVAMPSFKPAANASLSSRFGYRRDPFSGRPAMHNGMDFKGPHGTPILAAAKGKVGFAGWKAGYGRCVEIIHANGLMTRYAHLSRLSVSPGQRVKRGARLGRMGNTGRSTGTHLHFEVRLGGRAINPRPFLEANSDVLEVQADARKRSNARAES